MEKLKTLSPGDESIAKLYDKFVYRMTNRKKNQESLFKSVFKTKLYDEKKLVVKEKWLPTDVNPENPRVFMYIKIGSRAAKKIEFELFKDRIPKAVENFRSLCTGDNNTEHFVFHYKKSNIHKVEKGAYLLGGDIENNDGSGGYSIYGRYFDAESFIYPHSESGVLSMYANDNKSLNSQFMISLKALPEFNEKFLVIGKVVSGLDVLWEVNEVSLDMNGKPSLDVVIDECGEVLPESVD